MYFLSNINMDRVCSKCGCEKPLTEFYIRAGRYARRCKVCILEQNANYRKANPIRVQETQKKWSIRKKHKEALERLADVDEEIARVKRITPRVEVYAADALQMLDVPRFEVTVPPYTTQIQDFVAWRYVKIVPLPLNMNTSTESLIGSPPQRSLMSLDVICNPADSDK